MEAELVYLSDEQGEYRQPLRREVGRLLSGWGLEALLDTPGGIHFAPSAGSMADSSSSSSAAFPSASLP